jgi:glyoxylase-like metal-dependent hydrolase (beta-lactamase superfamily II)
LGSLTPANSEHQGPFAAAEAAGITRIEVSTPFAVGSVNVYLIDDDPLTLIDAGPKSADALGELRDGIARAGHSLEDIRLVIVTHQHIDHMGLVSTVVDASGAEVAAIDAAVPILANFEEEADADDDFARETMLTNGVPEDVVAALRSVSAAFHVWAAPVRVTRPLADGDEVELRDRRLRAHHRPGHSPTDTVFHDEGRRILFAGDHLLRHISSNPLLTRPRVEGQPRPQALVAYIDSLRATRELDVELVLAGHGDPVTDHRGLIDERLALHERRAAKIERLLQERPRTAYEIARSLWGNIAVTQAYLTLSEVLGHVDLLLNAGRAVERRDGGRTVFEAAG